MAATLTLDFTAVSPDPDGDNEYVIEATPRQSAGRNRAPRGKYRIIAFAPAADLGAAGGDPISWDLLAAYVAKFGPLVSGSRIFFRLTVIGTQLTTGKASRGANSLPLEFQHIVA